MRLAALVLILVVLVSGSAAQSATPIASFPDFKTDGCSLFPDGTYRDCCVTHDEAYYVGGSLKQRRHADKQLYKCVRRRGVGKLKASIMYLGVRAGGVFFLPTPFRWGFGNKYPHKGPKRWVEPTVTDR